MSVTTHAPGLGRRRGATPERERLEARPRAACTRGPARSVGSAAVGAGADEVEPVVGGVEPVLGGDAPERPIEVALDAGRRREVLDLPAAGADQVVVVMPGEILGQLVA